MKTKSERREQRRFKKRHGMQIRGRSLKSMLQHQKGSNKRKPRRRRR